MGNVIHSKQQVADGIHTPIAFDYANAAARTGATGFVSTDLYKFARQTDDGSIWILTAITPTWVRVGVSGLTAIEIINTPAGSIVATTVQAAINELDTEKQGVLTNSAGLAAALSDETGTGLAVFNNGPTLISPILGVATCTSINALTPTALATGFSIAGGTTSKTLTVDETISISAKAPIASPVFTTQISTPKIVTASEGLNITPAASGAVTIGDGTASAVQTLAINGGTATGKGAGFSLKKGGTQFFAFFDEAAITGAGTSNIPCLFAESGLGMKFFVDGAVTVAKTLFIASDMKVGIAVDPTARLHLPAGTTVANTAPLQFTSGTVETTPRAGLVEYNGRFIVTESDTANRYLVQAASSTKTTAGAPYTNDGFVTVVINGTSVKLMTTA